MENLVLEQRSASNWTIEVHKDFTIVAAAAKTVFYHHMLEEGAVRPKFDILISN